MSYQVLARKWRPTTFADLIGQNEIRKTLENALASNRIAHAYLFTGVRGVGKTTSARLLAKALNCEKGPTATPCNQCSACQEIMLGSHLDVREIDGASNTGVDDVRELKESLNYLPSQGRYKVYIIDEVHMLSKAAFNALLKTLEEPPTHVVFILATTEPHKLPETILSRCQRFDFKRVASEIIAQQLQQILAHEKVEMSSNLVMAIAKQAEGSVRDALTLTDRLLAWGGNKIDEKNAAELLGLIDQEQIATMLTQLAQGEVAAALQSLHKVYYAGFELKQLIEHLLEQLRLALLQHAGLDMQQMQVSSETLNSLQRWSKQLSDIELDRYFELTKRCSLELSRFDQPLYLVENLFTKLARVKSDFVAVHEVLRYLKQQQTGMPANHSSSAMNQATDAAAKPVAHETIEDPYIKKTVSLFGAKVEKIQVQGE